MPMSYYSFATAEIARISALYGPDQKDCITNLNHFFILFTATAEEGMSAGRRPPR